MFIRKISLNYKTNFFHYPSRSEVGRNGETHQTWTSKKREPDICTGAGQFSCETLAPEFPPQYVANLHFSDRLNQNVKETADPNELF